MQLNSIYWSKYIWFQSINFRREIKEKEKKAFRDQEVVARRCTVKKICLKKFRKIQKKTPVLQAWDSNTGVFPWILWTF